MKAIAIVGPMASGKGEVVKFLKEKGYCAFSLSDRIREELMRQGLEITRSNLRDMAHKLRKELGPDILARRTVEKADESGCDRVVVDAVRNPFELSYIRNKLNAVVLAVNATQERRYKFLQKRGRTGDIKTFEEFVKQDNKELRSGVDHKMNILEAMQYADHRIENDGTLEDLRQKIEDVLDKIS